MEKDLHCTRCRLEFTSKEVEGLNACPNCGTISLPMAIKDDVEIRINLHELRILGIWAENHAVTCDKRNLDTPGYESMKKTVNIIATILEKQIQEKIGRYCPLTLTHELQELPGELKKMGITHGPIQFFRGGKEELIDEELS